MGLGGAQRVVHTLIEIENHFAHSLRTPEYSIQHRKEYGLNEKKNKFNLKYLWETYQTVKRKDIDYIQCHMPLAKVVGLAIKLTPGVDIRLVFHEHGTIHRRNFFYDKFLNITDFIVYNHITVSQKSKELLCEAGIDEEKINIIRNFADTEKFSKSNIKGYKLSTDNKQNSEDKFKVGFAGRIVDRKGWRALVEAKDYLDDTEIIIAGTGKESEKLEELTSRKDEIEYVGCVDDIRELFNAVDCMAIPSKWDPNPLIFYESQAAEIPVVASKCNSLNEVAKDNENSLLFEPKNSRELAQKIRRIHENTRLAQKIVENGRKFAEENDKAKFKDNFESFYKKC